MKVEGGCTLCNGDVRGDKEIGFYCKNCNLLFSSKYVNFSSSKKVAQEQIKRHFVREEKIVLEVEKKPALKPKSPKPLKSAAQRLARHAKSVEKMQGKLDLAIEKLAAVEAKRTGLQIKKSPRKKASKSTTKKTAKPKKKAVKKVKKAKKVVKKKTVAKAKKKVAKKSIKNVKKKVAKKSISSKVKKAKKVANKSAKKSSKTQDSSMLRGLVSDEKKEIEDLLRF